MIRMYVCIYVYIYIYTHYIYIYIYIHIHTHASCRSPWHVEIPPLMSRIGPWAEADKSWISVCGVGAPRTLLLETFFLKRDAVVFLSKILRVCGFDTIGILLSRGENPQHTGSSPGFSTWIILVCKILVWRMAEPFGKTMRSGNICWPSKRDPMWKPHLAPQELTQ